jgi:hypothetical protein
MRRLLAVVGVIGLVTAIADWWRRHPRVGASYVNHVVDPWLLRRGIVAESAGEIGLIEHVGRVSGTVRHTPVHPVATEHGYRTSSRSATTRSGPRTFSPRVTAGSRSTRPSTRSPSRR